ncbi:MAG: hypothetical protein JW860_04525, partial [Sedimentisphaerales bacterium]|nr:hypothetical protein [Sedimentisphaerales bacterium]
GGDDWQGIKHGLSEVDPDGLSILFGRQAAAGSEIGRLYGDSQGQWGILAEVYYLKLNLLHQLATAVQTIIEKQKQPILNLNAQSFRVALNGVGQYVPFLWSARIVPADSGDVITLPVQTSDAHYYIPATQGGTSVYRPVSASLFVKGRATVRIRQVLPDTSEGVILEGTLASQERVQTGPRDLLWMRLTLAEGRLDLYGHLEEDSALAAGEWRFRTIGRNLTGSELKSIKAAEGVPIPETPFEIISLLSSPCDLYSLAVLAVRILCVDKETTLPVALDEMLSLARQVKLDYSDEHDLPIRIKQIFDSDQRWGQSLWPQRLIYKNITPADAFEVMPQDLWYKTLAMMVKLFPGIGPDSVCRDYGDAPSGALHRIFDGLLQDLNELLLRSRSLILADCRFNREVNKLIGKYLLRLGAGKDVSGN